MKIKTVSRKSRLALVRYRALLDLGYRVHKISWATITFIKD